MRAAALARHAIRSNGRAPLTWGGLAAFVVLAALAALVGGEDARSVDGDLLGGGLLVAALFALRSGLEEHREGDLDVFLRHNFVSAAEYAAAMALSVLGTCALLLAFAFLTALVASSLDVGYAAWFTAGYALRMGLLLPFIPWVESLARLRIPFLIPALAYLALILVLALTVGETRMIEIVGPRGESGQPATWLPLAIRAGVILPTVLGAFVATAWLLDRRRRGTGGQPRHR